MRIAGLLLRPLTQAIDWMPLGVTALLTITLATSTGMGTGSGLGMFHAVVLLRLSAILIGVAAGFVLVDPLTASTGALPVPRWLRQWVRALLGATAGASMWCVVYTIAVSRLTDGTRLPLAGLAAEAAVCVILGLACAAVAVRWHPERVAALMGATGLLGLLTLTLFLRGDLSPWILPGRRGWDEVHLGWLAALPPAVICLAFANRDLR